MTEIERTKESSRDLLGYESPNIQRGPQIRTLIRHLYTVMDHDLERQTARAGIFIWPQEKNVLYHWAFAVDQHANGFYHLFHITGDLLVQGYRREFNRVWNREQSSRRGTFYPLGDIAVEYSIDLTWEDLPGVPDRDSEPLKDDEIEKIAAAIPVKSEPMPLASQKELEGSSTAEYLEWLTQDFPEYPRCDAWVRQLVEALIDNSILPAEARDVLPSIPRLVCPIPEFLTRLRQPSLPAVPNPQ